MHQKEFRLLLRKYRKGVCTPEEQALIEQWYNDIAVNRDDNVAEQAAIKARSLERVREHAALHGANSHARPGKYIGATHGWAIAAVILLFVVSLLFIIGTPRSGTFDAPRQHTERTISNNSGDQMLVQLSDGSKVYLKPGSEITFADPFPNNERLITLEGEAFFEVMRDTLSPFVVNTNEVVTRVLGTSFTVSAFHDDASIVVSVATGTVSVLTRQSDLASSETILTPNQTIVYDRVKKVVSRGLVNEPRQIVPPEVVQRMRFEEAPVSRIFEGLEKVYGVDIEFDREIFASCVLTTSVAEGNIYNRLEMICKAINATYTLEGSRIVIVGTGCGDEHE